MSSLPQIEANRRNGKLSKGPKTSAGKAIAARNSVKHGLLSHQILLPNEDASALAEMGERLREELQPTGELESRLVDRIIELACRLGRFAKIEAGILSWHYYEVLAERAGKKAAKQIQKIPGPLDTHLGAYGEKTQVLDTAEHGQAVAEQRKHELDRESDTATCGEAFVRDSRRENALPKLSRYETAIERSLFKAYHELQRLQAARQGKEVPLPLALDVNISGLQKR
jgi:hypothetical protein